MSFFRKSLKEFRVLLLVVNCCRDVELMVRRNPCIDLFLLILFDRKVQLVNCNLTCGGIREDR